MNLWLKTWIDGATYEQLLQKWRYSAIGDPIFLGETGEYLSKIMFEKRALLSDGGVSASKTVGWN
jgi:hypothetical protein